MTRIWHWLRCVTDYVLTPSPRLTDKDCEVEADNDWKQIEVYIDGPYGAPAVDIFEAEHAVLIAAGIGEECDVT